MIRIVLPWPPKDLSPNKRHRHWSGRARAVKAYRDACGWELVAQGVKPLPADCLKATITFCAPDNRARDIDNMLSSIKAGIDATARVVGIDDSRWEITIARGAVKPRVGAVVVELEAA